MLKQNFFLLAHGIFVSRPPLRPCAAMGNQTSAEECARKGGTCIDDRENGLNLLDPCVLPAFPGWHS